MKLDHHPIVDYACVTIEALSAHAVAAGTDSAVYDNLIVRDANGLPAIPPTSLAGVLRNHYQLAHGEQATNLLFGFHEKDQAAISLIDFSWAYAHNSDDQPSERILTAGELERDPVLDLLTETSPVLRNRVRINSRGTASDEGKFDASWAPKGTRYSFFINIYSEAPNQAWEQIQQLLQSPCLYIGAGTRSGTGRFKVSEIYHQQWDLRKPEDFETYCQRPRTRKDATPNVKLENTPASAIILNLQAEDGWCVGGGSHDFGGNDVSKDPDIIPYSETTLEWQKKGQVANHTPVLPGSAIKGPLAHRMAFHANRLNGIWASKNNAIECPEVIALLGEACDDDQEKDKNTGHAGLIHIADAYLYPSDIKPHNIMHNKIDHFTGGVMNGALFCEQVFWQTPISIRIDLFKSPLWQGVNKVAIDAFCHALEDLAQGRLPLGAGANRGHGTMKLAQGEENTLAHMKQTLYTFAGVSGDDN